MDSIEKIIKTKKANCEMVGMEYKDCRFYSDNLLRLVDLGCVDAYKMLSDLIYFMSEDDIKRFATDRSMVEVGDGQYLPDVYDTQECERYVSFNGEIS